MEFLWKEYNLIYGIYEGYGGQLIELKGWSVTVGLAALLAAYSKPVSKNGRIAVLIAALSANPFWLTETLWKQFQNANLSRLKEIEKCAKVGMRLVQYCNRFPPGIWHTRQINMLVGLKLLLIRTFCYPTLFFLFWDLCCSLNGHLGAKRNPGEC